MKKNLLTLLAMLGLCATSPAFSAYPKIKVTNETPYHGAVTAVWETERGDNGVRIAPGATIDLTGATIDFSGSKLKEISALLAIPGEPAPRTVTPYKGDGTLRKNFQIVPGVRGTGFVLEPKN